MKSLLHANAYLHSKHREQQFAKTAARAQTAYTTWRECGHPRAAEWADTTLKERLLWIGIVSTLTDPESELMSWWG